MRSVFLCLLVNAAIFSAAAAERPNVVLIMTDNHGAWTLGCYGNRDIRTPNIDRLAAEGTLFTHAFASNPVCSPTRATYLTGLVPSQHGVHSFLSAGNLQIGPDARNTLQDFTSLPEVLRDNGYACGLVGKWHLGDNLRPQEGLDDYWITMPHGGTSTFYDAAVIEAGKIRTEPQYLTDLWTKHAIKFIKQRAAREKPFFLFLSYNGPYSLGRLLLRDGQNRHADYYADKTIPSFPRSQPHPWQLNNRDYINNPVSIRRVATEISGLDDGVGEVMAALKDSGIDENTVVIFVADQGWSGGHGGFFGMGDHTQPLTASDAMMRVPMIWRHPKGIAAGEQIETLVANYDLMPTLLGHLGLGDQLPASPVSPGTDFSALLSPDESKAEPLSQTTAAEQEAVFYEFEYLRCIRTQDAKYIHRYPNGPHELYDLQEDPDEFNNLAGREAYASLERQLKQRLDNFYREYALPKYDLWNQGQSQVRLHRGIDEKQVALASVDPPPFPQEFVIPEIYLPDGFEADLVAAPPLVTHPTMACFDDEGRLYICNNAGVNLRSDELEQQTPNEIRRLEDRDGDGRFDSFTVFADQMTFPMGGVWHGGSLYVASPPHIWKLTDTDDDGIADERQKLVEKFGYTGNAASIHGCFLGPDGRIYWTDGYHGHQFTDAEGNVTSEREGSYLFSCRPDGSDVQIHCGGGMDNPVEIDFTDAGDLLGTVNILYNRPRVDAMVHWLYGGLYPHRPRILQEAKVTGPLLGPAHRFGHVAVSGTTRYRSGTIDHRWTDDWFVTFFNSGKVVRLDVHEKGASYDATQHEFLSSPSRDFHPTDVLEDADGSLLVVDTGGWFYNGCPTSQFSKPDVKGGIYRVKRTGMTTMVDPRGQRIDWDALSPRQLTRKLNDTRFAVRQQAIDHCVRQASKLLPTLKSQLARGDIRVRQNSLWALARIGADAQYAEQSAAAISSALQDREPVIRQAACRALAQVVADVPADHLTRMLNDPVAAVRRQAASTLGRLGDPNAISHLIQQLNRNGIDRAEQHAATYALIEIGRPALIKQAMETHRLRPQAMLAVWTAIDQIDPSQLNFAAVKRLLESSTTDENRDAAAPAIEDFLTRVLQHRPEWSQPIAALLNDWLRNRQWSNHRSAAEVMLATYLEHESIASLLGKLLRSEKSTQREIALNTIAQASSVELHKSWVAPLRAELLQDDDRRLQLAMEAVASIAGAPFQDVLAEIAADPTRAVKQRVDALAAMVGPSAKLSDERFDQFVSIYNSSGSPTAADRSVQILASSRLNQQQRSRLTTLIRTASPSQLRDLLQPYRRSVDPSLAEDFLDAIEASKSWRQLSEPELSDVVKRFPKEWLPRANRLLDQLKIDHQQRLAKLQAIRNRVDSANVATGSTLFRSEKAKCSSCHRVGQEGKAVGPDLTSIGMNRSVEDLIESILFPSASIVRDYQTFQVLSVEGRVHTGIVTEETGAAIRLQLASGQQVSLRHEEIDQMEPSPISTMPSGLDEQLSDTELADIVKYLKSLQ